MRSCKRDSYTKVLDNNKTKGVWELRNKIRPLSTSYPEYFVDGHRSIYNKSDVVKFFL